MAHLERVILLVMALEKATKAPEKKELEMMGLEITDLAQEWVVLDLV